MFFLKTIKKFWFELFFIVLAFLFCITEVNAQFYRPHVRTQSLSVIGDAAIEEDSSGGNLGAKNQLTGLVNMGLVAVGTMVDGSGETTSYMDDTPTGEWTEVDANAAVTLTADTSYARIGSKSLKIALTEDAAAGDGASNDITNDDLSSNESVGFWIYAGAPITSGDFQVKLDDTDGTDQTYTVGAVAEGVWTWIELDVSGCDTNCDTTDKVQFLMTTQGATNLDAINIYIDGMWKWDADAEEDLGTTIVDHGVIGVQTVATAAGSANTPAVKTENTDYFVHYAATGNDMIVTITDQSANSGTVVIMKE